MRSSESIAALAAALVAAHGVMPNVPKETVGQVGNQKRNYADLATVTEIARPILAAHGLAWVQGLSDGADGRVTVTTRIVHTSGEWIEESLSMPTGSGGAQQVGSACTYGRRYSLMAMLGLAPEDDDGAAATAAHRTDQSAEPASVHVHKLLKTVEKGSPKAVELKRLAAVMEEPLTEPGLQKASWRAVVEGVLANESLSSKADSHAEEIADAAVEHGQLPIEADQ